jgi:hypothetical protein
VNTGMRLAKYKLESLSLEPTYFVKFVINQLLHQRWCKFYVNIRSSNVNVRVYCVGIHLETYLLAVGRALCHS